jgi:hypothetical protein
MAQSNLDKKGDNMAHLASGGSGVTGSSDSSLTIVGTDAIINLANTTTLAAMAVATMSALMSDGADGDVTISGGTTTLTRDMFYNNLVVDGTGILVARGWRIYARKVTVNASGIIHWDGADASGATGGAAFTQGSFPANLAGVNGGTGAGTNGNNAANLPLPRAGALGGLFRGGTGGTSGANGGGTAGTVTLASLGRYLRNNSLTGMSANATAFSTGAGAGSSGGSGGGDGTNAGGGSGAGGGFGYIGAGEVINNGTIRAKGGAGGAGTAGNAAGGGPGGGGSIEITCGKFSGNNPDVSAGAVGAGVGTGTNGSAGTAGDYFINIPKFT